MELDLQELKGQARDSMSQASPGFRTVTLVYILMTTGVSILLSLIPLPVSSQNEMGTGTIFINILYSLYAAVAGFGFTLWALWITRRLSPGLSALMQGFSVAGRVIWMKLMIYLRLVCFVMMFTIAISFGLMVLTPLFLLLARYPLVMLAVVYCLLFGGMWLFSLRYALAPYLLADHPDDGPIIPIRRSVALMRGWKRELFRLELSFLGWHLAVLVLTLLVQGGALWYFGVLDLAMPATMEAAAEMTVYCAAAIAHPLTVLATTVVTLPVLLWVKPYREVARAAFYDARLLVPQYPDRPMMPPV